MIQSKSGALFAAIAVMLFGGVAFKAEAARPVARWDVVPSQRVTGVFKAGVVAFHEKGVKVEFDVAGKKFVAENPKLNDRVGVWEYFVPINTEKLPDGPIAVKAKAVTLDGTEYYDLPELLLYADNKKSVGSHESVTIGPDESLKEAIAKVGDGGMVYLKKGVYTPQGLGGKGRKGGPAGLFGLDALEVEEGWKDAAAHDFALKSGSPALTHGMPLQCVPTDINGNPYPTGPRPCGAYAK